LKVFSEEIAGNYDRWLDTPFGRYVDAREKKLISDLLLPKPGERILDVGCGTGHHLLFFHEIGCHVSGIEPSAHMLDIARFKLGGKAELRAGFAEDLPYSDNEFDAVTMITSLEFCANPEAALGEMIRVSRNRVFLGVLNKYSILGGYRKMRSCIKKSVYSEARFYAVHELIEMIKSHLGNVRIDWGSVIFIPPPFYSLATGLEEKIPTIKNPFGAFLGIAFSVAYRYRTLQDPVREHIKLSVNARRTEARGAVRGMHFHSRSYSESGSFHGISSSPKESARTFRALSRRKEGTRSSTSPNPSRVIA